MNNSEYWNSRIAENTWGTYNSLEEKNRALLEMYQEASLDISEELYKVTEKINGGKGVSLSDMHKFNRLKALKANFENIMRKLGEDVEKFGKDNMKEGSKKVYENVMTELGQTDFALPNEKLMEEMMNRPWEGSTFSQRLWKNTQVLASNLNELLTVGLQQGKTVTEIAINLNNRMNEGFNVSHRLVRTETMHYLNESAAKAYEDGGCEEVQLWAAVDERVCDVCGAKHGKTYNIKDRPVLPLHANCRCTYLPVISKDEARKDHDKAKQDVQNEWNRRKIPEEQIKDKKILNRTSDIKQLKKYQEVLGEDVPKTLEDFQNLKYNNIKEWENTKELKNYLEKYPTSDKRFYKIQNELKQLGIKNGVVLPSKPQQAFILADSKNKNDPNHIMNRMLERGITDDNVRNYMNNAKVMFVQWKGERQVFYSDEGVSIIIRKDDDWIFKTTWSKADFDEITQKILEVVNKHV